MAIGTTNTNLTQIAVKRLSGKAMTNSNSTIPVEKYGSTVQTVASTVFAESLPNNPGNTAGDLYLIQSASDGAPGTVMLVDFDVIPIADTVYQNDIVSGETNTSVYSGDQGETNINTNHGYILKLTGSFEADLNAIGATYFNDKASSGTTLGSVPFESGFTTSGSNKLQIVPEFVSTIVGTSNPYIPVISKSGSKNDFTTDPISSGADIDYYLDPFAGILFVQDPVSYTAGTGNVPGKVRAFIYVGKYQDEVTFSASDVNFKVSGSDDGFDVSNSDTINFISGSAGITVESNNSPGTITIGESTDNITVNQITASIINADTIEVSEFIISSSVTYMTQSFSSGSTIFGDTNDDTHQFTGSISVVHTGSGYGFELSGSSINIDAGSSGSLTLGNHNVGIDIVSNFPITGSGLIISQSNLPNFHYNMVKIGNVELLDYTGLSGDGFLIDTKDRAFIISSSNANKPIANLESGDTALYNGNGDITLKIDTTNTTLGTTLNSSTTNVLGSTTILGGSSNTHIRVHEGTPGNNTDDTDTSHVLFSVGQPDASFNSSNNKIESTPLNTLFTYLGGAVTASAVSSSGLLFASLSGDPTHNDGILTVVYDTGSGQFFYTGSYGAGGDTTDLEASASQGIYFWTGSGAGSSIGLMQTASFTSSGAGLGVDFNEGNNTFTYTLTPQNVFDAFDTANTGSFTASYANTASFTITASHALTASTVQVTNSSTSQNYGVVFADNTGSANLLSDQAYGLTFNPSSHALIVSGNDPSIIIDTGDFPDYHKIRVNQIDYTGSTYQLINSQGPQDNTDTTINFGIKTHTINMGATNGTVNIKGSASIDGDLIVKGAVTSIETTNLNVEDQFILLNSGSGVTTLDGGIIIRQTDTATGAALFLDSSVSRFAVAKGVAWDNTSDITTDTNPTMEYIVTITSSNGAPPTPEWGDNSNFTSYGNMYVDTDNGDIYIYGG